MTSPIGSKKGKKLMRKHKLSPKKSKRSFNKGTRTNKRNNTGSKPQRGGIRL